VLDSLNTTTGSFGVIALNFWNILPDIVSLIIGVLWIFYLYNKIRMEFK
tara:strand:- start:381 stop:527 length:147 start_codon:yes stop_codon:yes gene_type:complete